MTKGQELRERLVFKQPKTDKEWLELQKEVIDFLSADNNENEKKELCQYTEMLSMVCRGIKSK